MNGASRPNSDVDLLPRTFVLNGQAPEREPDLRAWAEWMRQGARIVRKDALEPGRGARLLICTYFTGIDYNPIRLSRRERERQLAPVVFETSVFGQEYDVVRERYTSWADAERGHVASVRALKESLA